MKKIALLLEVLSIALVVGCSDKSEGDDKTFIMLCPDKV